MSVDDEVLQLLAQVGHRGPASIGDGYLSRDLDYTVAVLGHDLNWIYLRLEQAGRRARLRLPMPSTGRPSPWLVWSVEGDPAGWVDDFLSWLDEEMFTGGLGPETVLVERDGQAWVVLAGYGFRRRDELRHRELAAAAGPYGWRDNHRSKKVIAAQYALEWALDEVEARLDHHNGPRWARESTTPAWSMTSADEITVDVVIEDIEDQQLLVVVRLRASTRRRRPLTTGRRVYFIK